MNIDQVIVLKETREGEGRVALTPNTVASLTSKNFKVMIEHGAGKLAGFSNEDYLHSGAQIFTFGQDLPSSSIILRVKRPIKSRELLENTCLKPNTVMIGFLDPFDVEHENHISTWNSLGVITISLELLPLTADDPKNAQAAMSRFAGRLALQDALRRYQGRLPIKISIFGTGPAGLGAAFAATELQLPVQLCGRQEIHRKKLEEMGIVYHVLPKVNEGSYIRKHLTQETIIITAARNIGHSSPLLIDAETLAMLPEQTVIIDLSSGEGGNVLGSKQDSVITIDRDISIVNVSGYPKAEPRQASEAFAACMVNLLNEIMPTSNEINLEHALLKKAYLK